MSAGDTAHTVSDILGDVINTATLRIFCRVTPAGRQAAEVKDRLLRLLVTHGSGILAASGCPLDEVSPRPSISSFLIAALVPVRLCYIEVPLSPCPCVVTLSPITFACSGELRDELRTLNTGHRRVGRSVATSTDDLRRGPHRETSNAIFRQNLAINLAAIGPPGKASDRPRQMEESATQRHPPARHRRHRRAATTAAAAAPSSNLRLSNSSMSLQTYVISKIY